MKKGPVELRADEEEGESESKITNQIFGHLQHPKKIEIFENEKYFFSDFRSDFPPQGVFATKVIKSKYQDTRKLQKL